MPDLATFLLARIAEQAAAQRGADAWHERFCGVNDDMGPTACDCGVPAHVLADCEAKRRIVEQFQRFEAQGYDDPSGVTHCHATGLLGAIKHLTASYADHPDYRENWRPEQPTTTSRD